MFTNLPPELRTQIYSYVLIQDTPLLIDYISGSIGIRHEQPTSTKHNTRNWSLLSVNRRIRHEGLCILLSTSHFVCIAEWRSNNDNCDFFAMEIPKGYLGFIKHVSFAAASDDWEDHDAPVRAMLLLNYFFKYRVQLRSLCVMQASYAAGMYRGRYTELMGANIMIPLAVRMYVAGLADRVLAGIARSVMGPEEEQTRQHNENPDSENLPWEPELFIHEVWKKAMESNKRKESHFVVFDAWYTRDPRTPYSILRAGFEALHTVPRTSGLKSRDLAPLSAFGEYPGYEQQLGRCPKQHPDKWYGETILMAEYDVEREDDPIPEVGAPACRVLFRYHIRDCWRFRPGRLHHRMPEWEDESLVQMTRENFWDLREAQEWWELWWAANLQGQRKIDGWLDRESIRA